MTGTSGSTFVAIVIVVSVAFVPACTKTLEVRTSDFRSMDVERNAFFRVYTVDKQRYDVKHIELRDSTIVINDPVSTSDDPRPYPIVLAYSEVESIEAAKGRHYGGIILISVAVVVIAIMLYFALDSNSDFSFGD